MKRINKRQLLPPLWVRFEYNRMPMGMKTAPAAFQRLVDVAILQAMPYPTACYIDDILLASPGEEQHFRHLSLLLEEIERNRNETES